MTVRRNTKLLVEPAAVATGDIAFNLIVFFLVCASSQPDGGVKQAIPRSEKQEQKSEETKNIEVRLTRDDQTCLVNGDATPMKDLVERIRRLMLGKTRPQDKVVVIKSELATPYQVWIRATTAVEEAGGSITIQREEEQTVAAPN